MANVAEHICSKRRSLIRVRQRKLLSQRCQSQRMEYSSAIFLHGSSTSRVGSQYCSICKNMNDGCHHGLI